MFSDTNPLRIIHHKFQSGISSSLDIFETEPLLDFASQINFYTSLVNMINAAVAFALVAVWFVTTSLGSRRSWIRARIFCAFCMLATTFVVIAALILTTYFADLVTLKEDTGYFITDNPSVNRFGSKVIKVALNGERIENLQYNTGGGTCRF